MKVLPIGLGLLALLFMASRKKGEAVARPGTPWAWGTEQANLVRMGEVLRVTWPITNNTGMVQPAQLEFQDGEGNILAVGRIVWVRNRQTKTLIASWRRDKVLPGGRGLTSSQIRVFVRGGLGLPTLNNRTLQLA